jgi:isopentenyl-diphosphate delta-isomerase
MGADLVGMALPLLKALDESGEEGAMDYVHQVVDELRVVMLLTGSKDLAALKDADYKLTWRAAQWKS